MLASIPLVISIVGIVGLITLKSWELRRSTVFFAERRRRVDAAIERFILKLRGDMPHSSKQFVSDMLHQLTVQITALALVMLRFLERKLTRFVNMIKGRREVRNGNGNGSAFLRDVTEHRDEVRRINGYHPSKKVASPSSK